MPETELLIRKAETLPKALFEEAEHYYRLFISKSTICLFFRKVG